MSDAINDALADRLLAAQGDRGASRELIGALIGGVALTIALDSRGDAKAASDLTERAAALLFESVTANVALIYGQVRS